jgi:transposase
VEVIRRCDDQKGFEVLPRRWVVERTFGWMMRWRRILRDYEQRIDVSQAMILVAMGGVTYCAETLIRDFPNGP